MTWWDIVDHWTGELQIDLSPYTLAEAHRMLTAARRSRWDPFAALMATLANCHRGREARPWTPQDFHPYATRRRRPSRGTRLTAATLPDFSAALKACHR